jgi:nondiscriminating glutamyl-tRNA synthetase
MIRTRFAPSPTGFLHVGGLRTALFAYLLAKKEGGQFILRIEDTDRARLAEGAIENFLHALSWANITVDEGVVLKDGKIEQIGDKGPYIQSERLDIYKKYITQLLDQGDAYYAFDTAEELADMREAQQAAKQPTIYNRDGMKNQLTLGEEETKKRMDAGEDHVIRLKMPREGETVFDDLVRGEVSIKNALIDDQVLIKSDGFPTYHLAVVVDDHEMEITHVIRGEEWISSTPKHIVLYDMFGWTIPTFAHLSLLVNEQKAKLSKRHGDVSVEDFREKGYLPEALINFIAFLGWNPGDEREIFTLGQLESEFAFDKVGKAAAVFNREKLDWYNQQYMRAMDISALTVMVAPHLVNHGQITNEQLADPGYVEWLELVVKMEQERASTLLDFSESVAFIFADALDYATELLTWKKADAADAKLKLEELQSFLDERTGEWSTQSLEDEVIAWIKEKEYGVGNVLWPTRVSLSGKKNSPGPFEIMNVLGKEKTLERMTSAINRIK